MKWEWHVLMYFSDSINLEVLIQKTINKFKHDAYLQFNIGRSKVNSYLQILSKVSPTNWN